MRRSWFTEEQVIGILKEHEAAPRSFAWFPPAPILPGGTTTACAARFASCAGGSSSVGLPTAPPSRVPWSSSGPSAFYWRNTSRCWHCRNRSTFIAQLRAMAQQLVLAEARINASDSNWTL